MKIKFDKRNYRKHNDKNKKLIKKSLDECGAGRSIVVDNEGEIIGGNGIYEAWGNKPVKVIETDGSELVVVKRTDLNTDDEKRKKLAIMDNSTSDSSEFVSSGFGSLVPGSSGSGLSGPGSSGPGSSVSSSNDPDTNVIFNGAIILILVSSVSLSTS